MPFRLFRSVRWVFALRCLPQPGQLRRPAAQSRGPSQYVLISFDSAHELSQWRRSRALAQRTGANFTYFLSCVFLLSPETRKIYTRPA